MRKGSLYKHIHSTDMVVECAWIMYIPEKKGYKAKLWYYSDMPWREPMLMGIRFKAFIPEDKIKDWIPYESKTNI